jgi:hypothetical protein
LLLWVLPISQLGVRCIVEEHCSARGFAIVGKLAQIFPCRDLDCGPDAFDGGFEVDGFWEYYS